MSNQKIIEAYPDRGLALLEMRERKLWLASPSYINGNAPDPVPDDTKLCREGVLTDSQIARFTRRWSEYGEMPAAICLSLN